jgi:hypothetical protein
MSSCIEQSWETRFSLLGEEWCYNERCAGARSRFPEGITERKASAKARAKAKAFGV